MGRTVGFPVNMPESALGGFAAALLSDLCARHPLGRTPELVWRKMRVSAGLARYETWQIVLSTLILTDEARVRDTLVHEFAHLLAYARHGRKGAGHGRAWREAMLDLGAKPEVRHRYEVCRNVRRQQVGYVCKRCGSTIVRSRRLPKKRRYLHAACGGAVVFAWAREATPPDSPA